jgi:ferredoxin
MKNLILYFSATGNTARLAGIVEAELRAAGQEVATATMSSGGPVPDCAGIDRLVVAFPVLSFSAPSFVKSFLRRLPGGARAGGKPIRAAVIACSGGDGTMALPGVAAMLGRRGYEVRQSLEAAYPENWIQMGGVPRDEAAAERGLERGDATARRIAGRIAADEIELIEVGAGKRLVNLVVGFLFGAFGRRFLGKLFVADERCSSCALCARTCPAGTIIMKKGRRARPFWRMNCENCNRCMNVCPEAAINTSILNIVLQFASIGTLLVVGIRAADDFLWPLIEPLLAPGLESSAHILLIAITVVAAHLFSIGPADYFVYRWLRRVPGLRRAFGLSFSRGFRRYKAPGFKPEKVE